MPRCSRKGCGQEFNPAEKSPNGCTYHPGAPVFHEGLKSWSCCAEVNKPVMEFDEFMKIPGCTHEESHTEEAVVPVESPKTASNANLTMKESDAGKEVYSSGNVTPTQNLGIAPAVVVPPVEIIEEEDDLNVPVTVGAKCRHAGCGTIFVSDDVNRNGDGEGTVCTYHPKPPHFREGSKGYLCCKRRVLEFDEFLKIKGCKTGRHVFVPKITTPVKEEATICRIDHYQTLSDVHVSIFAKNVDKESCVVKFEETETFFDLRLPGSKRFSRTLQLFGPIKPDESSFKIFGTKVELHLKKKDNRSWTVLEKTTQDLGNISLTFGVGGRTGTIGAKEIVLDESNKIRA